MKKNYVTPIAEKIEFDYTQQVVASGGGCHERPWATSLNQKSGDLNCVTGITWTH